MKWEWDKEDKKHIDTLKQLPFPKLSNDIKKLVADILQLFQLFQIHNFPFFPECYFHSIVGHY